jgi:hypothetical protein
MNAVMDILEFIFGLLELGELVVELSVLLYRAPGRLARWITTPSGERQRRPALPEESGVQFRADSRTIIHSSLTRRPRGKRPGGSYEAG